MKKNFKIALISVGLISIVGFGITSSLNSYNHTVEQNKQASKIDSYEKYKSMNVKELDSKINSLSSMNVLKANKKLKSDVIYQMKQSLIKKINKDEKTVNDTKFTDDKVASKAFDSLSFEIMNLKSLNKTEKSNLLNKVSVDKSTIVNKLLLDKKKEDDKKTEESKKQSEDSTQSTQPSSVDQNNQVSNQTSQPSSQLPSQSYQSTSQAPSQSYQAPAQQYQAPAYKAPATPAYHAPSYQAPSNNGNTKEIVGNNGNTIGTVTDNNGTINAKGDNGEQFLTIR